MTEIKKIATHVQVDIDAIIGSCVELIRHEMLPTAETIMFVSADTPKVPEDVLAVDIRARKHGNAPSYVGWLCKDILPYQIVEEVNEQDSTGRTSSRVPLCIISAALQMAGKSDLEIVQHFYPIVKGWIALKKEWDAADSIVASLPKVEIGDYKFLISVDVDSRGLSNSGTRAGLTGTIFWGKDGCGITIYPAPNQLNLAHLALDGWYADSRGFLFCYGSRKAPKTEADLPPPQFPTVEAFIEYLKKQEVFYN
jgi:hypothetical protein